MVAAAAATGQPAAAGSAHRASRPRGRPHDRRVGRHACRGGVVAGCGHYCLRAADERRTSPGSAYGSALRPPGSALRPPEGRRRPTCANGSRGSRACWPHRGGAPTASHSLEMPPPRRPPDDRPPPVRGPAQGRADAWTRPAAGGIFGTCRRRATCGRFPTCGTLATCGRLDVCRMILLNSYSMLPIVAAGENPLPTAEKIAARGWTRLARVCYPYASHDLHLPERPGGSGRRGPWRAAAPHSGVGGGDRR